MGRSTSANPRGASVGRASKPLGMLRRRISARVFAGLTAGSLLVISLVLSQIALLNYVHRERYAQQVQVLQAASTVRGALDTELSSTLYLAHGLISFIKSVENPSPRQIRDALRAVHNADSRVRNIGLAPDNRLTYIHPLAGNETAIGLNFERNPSQWPGVERAMETGKSVLVGPINLVQGGRAIINRSPVFLDDGTYWGLISIVIDIDRLLNHVGLHEVVGDTRFWLTGDQLNGNNAGALIVGNQPPPADAIDMAIDLPGTDWRLAAKPSHGWYPQPSDIWPLRAAGLALSFALAWFVWTLLRSRARAHSLADGTQRLNIDLAAKNLQLEELSLRDGLTGVANRRCFDQLYPHAWARCRRQQNPISVLMVDADRFKSINDQHGHAAGDSCIVAVAECMRRVLRRADDFIARYGGEEFVVVLENTGAEAAANIAEAIRQEIEGTPIWLQPQGGSIRITVSVGLATAIPSEAIAATELCRQADLALYDAKANGRNRVQQRDLGPPPSGAATASGSDGITATGSRHGSNRG